MARGDQEDCARRIFGVLPAGWFRPALDDNPRLRAVLAMPAALGAMLFDGIGFARRQTRIATAAGGWLDLAAFDFLGLRVRRRPGQGDDAFRQRVQVEVLRPRNTRPALRRLLLDLTGREPTIIEPGRVQDTGGYGVAMGYGAAGRYGNIALPGQAFIEVRRSTTDGLPNIAGYGAPIGGYGVGAIQYASPDMAASGIADDDILAAIAATVPAGVVAWTRISG